MYEFCYDFVKPKYGRKPKLCYIYIQTDDIDKDIVKSC